MSPEFMNTPAFNFIILPILIFLARIVDVSIGTVRIMFIAKGYKLWAPILGFFEILIWLLAVRQIMINMSNIYCYLAFAGGFTTGNYVGMIIEEKLAVGIEIVRIITRREAHDLIEVLRRKGYGVTSVDAKGAVGDVSIIFTIVNRKDTPRVIALVKKHNPKAFYTVEDVRSVSEIFKPTHHSRVLNAASDADKE